MTRPKKQPPKKMEKKESQKIKKVHPHQRIHNMEYLKVDKKKRDEDKKKNQSLHEMMGLDEQKHYDQQKERIKNFVEGGKDEYAERVMGYQKFNRFNDNDPFDVPLKFLNRSVQTSLFGFKKMYPIMYMTHINEPLSRFCVLNIKEINNTAKEQKKVIFIDPGVADLQKPENNGEYPNLDKLHKLAQGDLQPHEYISIDYPCDYDPSQEDMLIKKSVDNNFKYKDNPQYICCIQSKLGDADDFIYRFRELEPIFAGQKKIVGIGAACSHTLNPNDYTNTVFKFLAKNVSKLYWVHFYGIGMTLMKEYFPMLQNAGMKVSYDSTKYRFAVTEDLKHRYGLIANNDSAPLYFYSYIEQLLKTPLAVIW